MIKVKAWDAVRKKMFTSPKWAEFSVNISGELTAKNYARDSNEQYLTVLQWSGLQDSENKDIYEGDIVYLAGYGDYTAVFPFIELYEAGIEKDIGKIKGNIFEGIK